MVSHTRWFPVVAIALACHTAAAGEATGDYATDLATVYGGYQRLLGMREACDAAVPEFRTATAQAFSAWQSQHRALIDELRQRVNTMIRLASRDEKDYARNLGKYEGAILQDRNEYRQALLALKADELRERCGRLPEMLKGPGADLGKVFAAELQTIRQRKQ